MSSECSTPCFETLRTFGNDTKLLAHLHSPCTATTFWTLIVFGTIEFAFVNRQGAMERAAGNTGRGHQRRKRSYGSYIVRLILQGSVEQAAQMGRPWSWPTNDEALGRRVTDIVRRLSIEEGLLDIDVANNEGNTFLPTGLGQFSGPGFKVSQAR